MPVQVVCDLCQIASLYLGNVNAEDGLVSSYQPTLSLHAFLFDNHMDSIHLGYNIIVVSIKICYP